MSSFFFSRTVENVVGFAQNFDPRKEEDKEEEFELHEENDPLRDLSLLLSLLVREEEEEEKVKVFVVVNAKGVITCLIDFLCKLFPSSFFCEQGKEMPKP